MRVKIQVIADGNNVMKLLRAKLGRPQKVRALGITKNNILTLS